MIVAWVPMTPIFPLRVAAVARRTAGDAWGLRDLPILLYLGVFGVALNQLFFVLGVSMTSVAHAAFIIETPIDAMDVAALVQRALGRTS